MSTDSKPAENLETSHDLVVTDQSKKWKSGKGYKYKITMELLKSEGAKVKMTIESSNSALFQKYPQNEVFTVKVKDSEQQQLPEEGDED